MTLCRIRPRHIDSSAGMQYPGTGLFWIPVVDIGLCLAGLICGIVSLVKGMGGKGLAIAGLVISVLASILTLLFLYFFALGMMLM